MATILQKHMLLAPGRPIRLSATEENRVKTALHHWKEARHYRTMGTTYDDVVAQLDVSKHAFNTYFTVHLQEDFRTWRTRLRIEEAKTLLLHQRGLSASKIGEMVGFSNRSNFTNQFQHHVGCSPAQWREKHPE